ncbi:MAG: hypothetical protein ACPG3U_06425 [Rhodothermales bacterium]
MRAPNVVSHIEVDELDQEIFEIEAAAALLNRELSVELERSMRHLERQLKEAEELVARRAQPADATDT